MLVSDVVDAESRTITYDFLQVAFSAGCFIFVMFRGAVIASLSFANREEKSDRVCIISSTLFFFGACQFRKFEIVLLVVSLRSKYRRQDVFLSMQSGAERGRRREVCLCTQVNTDYSYFLLAMYQQRSDRAVWRCVSGYQRVSSKYESRKSPS